MRATTPASTIRLTAASAVLPLLLGLFGCSTPATGGNDFRAGTPFGAEPDGYNSLPSPPAISPRPHYVPGKGWRTLAPYGGGDYVDPKTGRIWIRTPHGATQPRTGDLIPGRP